MRTKECILCKHHRLCDDGTYHCDTCPCHEGRVECVCTTYAMEDYCPMYTPTQGDEKDREDILWK